MMTIVILCESLITLEAINYHWMGGLIDIYEDQLHNIVAKLAKINWRLIEDQLEMLKD